MENIIDLFDNLLRTCGSVDIAEAEFKRMISESPELRTDYRKWCHETGHTERRGFLDYADEYFESQDSVWDTLKDYDEHDDF